MGAATPLGLAESTLTWTHPTGRIPEKVLIVALGPTKLDLLEMTTGHEPPAVVMDVDEVWGINAGCNHLAGRVAYDMLWVMDYLEGEARRLPRYGDLLARWAKRHGGQIMTSQAERWSAWNELTSQVSDYPLQWVVDQVGSANAYFHNSLPYLLAYALCIGTKELVIWGADYSHEASKRREEDRANAEYWIGFCRAKGMTIWLPNTTTLCNASRGAYYYGYRDLPEIKDSEENQNPA